MGADLFALREDKMRRFHWGKKPQPQSRTCHSQERNAHFAFREFCEATKNLSFSLFFGEILRFAQNDRKPGMDQPYPGKVAQARRCMVGMRREPISSLGRKALAPQRSEIC